MGRAKPKTDPEVLALQKESLELQRQALDQQVMPKIPAMPKPLPDPMPVTVGSQEVEAAAMAAKKGSLKKQGFGQTSVLAGETGGYKSVLTKNGI